MSKAGGYGTKLNIMLIPADDIGYFDIGCSGSEIETSSLDSLATNGLCFTQSSASLSGRSGYRPISSNASNISQPGSVSSTLSAITEGSPQMFRSSATLLFRNFGSGWML